MRMSGFSSAFDPWGVCCVETHKENVHDLFERAFRKLLLRQALFVTN